MSAALSSRKLAPSDCIKLYTRSENNDDENFV